MSAPMTLDTIDWKTITEAQARRLLGAARQREQAAAKKYGSSDSDEFEDEWRAAYQLEEDLVVFSKTGLRPGEH
jgi:hypothetical protein